jgi:hydrogenase expression/formation protein HypC
MCLAVPVRVESIDEGQATCRVGEGETFLTTSLMLLDEKVVIGDYLIVHAGFALRRLDLQEAEETLRMLREMIRLSESSGHDNPGPFDPRQ